MSLVSATVAAVLFSLSTPDAAPEVFAAFFTADAPVACERTAKALNDAEPINGRRFHCE